MVCRLRALVLLLLLASTFPSFAGTLILDFEGLSDGTVLQHQFGSLTFTNAIIRTANFSLNEGEFPPHSGINVVSDNGGPISIGFAVAALSFSGYFTYVEPLTLIAFDSANHQVARSSSQYSANYVSSGNPPNEFISLAYAGGISSVTIAGDPGGGSFAGDDFSIQTPNASVPELPMTALLASGLTLIVFLRTAN